MYPRNKHGQFIVTNGNQRYKGVQYKNKRMGEHTRAVLTHLGLNDIPEGFVVHHLDENKKNNDINNLALITITAHNRIHSHPAWNSGITTESNPKWKATIDKIAKIKRGKYLPVCREAVELQSHGKTLREIAITFGISRRQVSDRIKAWKLHARESLGGRPLSSASRVLQ